MQTCACHALIDENHARNIQNNLLKDLSFQCPEPDLEAIIYGKWTRIPLLLADHLNGELRWALLGLNAQMLPGMTKKLMAPESIEAVLEAASLADAGHAFCFWPILDHTGGKKLIQGRSLGLPVYLGACISWHKVFSGP